jgi:hypothetical protein
LAETSADLRKHLVTAIRALLALDLESELLTEYLGNMCGTPAATRSTSKDTKLDDDSTAG